MSHKKVIIVRTPQGVKYAHYVGKELNSMGIKYEVLSKIELKEQLEKGTFSPENTLIHTRTANPDDAYQILKAAKDQGFRVINDPETVKLTSDKFASCDFALKNDIPCADTLKIKKQDAEMVITEQLKKWPGVIVKPVVSQGQGIYCFKFDKDNTDFSKIKDIPTDDLVIQEYIEYTRLSRVLVIGFKALQEAVFYDEPGQGWKCSVCLNPNIKHYTNPPQELIDLAESTAKKINAEISFIDFFTTEKGFVLNEINTACNLSTHERMSGHNISKAIAEYLVSQM